MIAAALALALLPDPPAARTELIWSYADARVSRQVDDWFTNGDFPRSVQLLREQWAYSPHNYDVATNLGWMLENMHEDESAIRVYGEYRGFNPQDLDGRLPEAQLHSSRRHPEKVIEVLEPLVATLDSKGRRPGTNARPHPNVFRLLAKAYERTGKPDRAIATWELQLRAYPGDGPAGANIRRVRAKLSAPAAPPVAHPVEGVQKPLATGGTKTPPSR